MEAIILAGGLGTRLRSVVPDLPKPMALINDRPFLELLLDYWIEQGVNHFILSVGYKADVIIQHFGNNYRSATLSYAIEESPLGTGGALLAALPLLKQQSDFVLLNGDTFFEVNLLKMQAFHTSHLSNLTIALRRIDHNPKRYTTIILNENAEIIDFVERHEGDNCLINAGVYLINPGLFAELAVSNKVMSFEGDLLPLLMKQCIYGYEGAGKFIDIGIPEDYLVAQSLLSV